MLVDKEGLIISPAYMLNLQEHLIFKAIGDAKIFHSFEYINDDDFDPRHFANGEDRRTTSIINLVFGKDLMPKLSGFDVDDKKELSRMLSDAMRFSTILDLAKRGNSELNSFTTEDRVLYKIIRHNLCLGECNDLIPVRIGDRVENFHLFYNKSYPKYSMTMDNNLGHSFNSERCNIMLSIHAKNIVEAQQKLAEDHLSLMEFGFFSYEWRDEKNHYFCRTALISPRRHNSTMRELVDIFKGDRADGSVSYVLTIEDRIDVSSEYTVVDLEVLLTFLNGDLTIEVVGKRNDPLGNKIVSILKNLDYILTGRK